MLEWLAAVMAYEWFFPALATLLVGLLSASALFNVHRTNRRLQVALTRAQIQLEFEKRYMTLTLEDEPRLLTPAVDFEARQRAVEAYARRYWTQQFHQFINWSQGLIDPPTFAYWMRRRREECVANRKIGSMSYTNAMKIGLDFQGNAVFAEFMGIMVSGDAKSRRRAILHSRRWYRRFRKFELHQAS